MTGDTGSTGMTGDTGATGDIGPTGPAGGGGTLQGGMEVLSQPAVTETNSSLIVFPVAFGAVPDVVATSVGSTDEYIERYSTLYITNVTLSDFTVANKMLYTYFYSGESSSTSGIYSSMIILSDGTPAMAYIDSSFNMRFAKNSLSNGEGVWTVNTIENIGGAGTIGNLALLSNGHPAISYHDTTNASLKYAYSANAEGSIGSWTIVTVHDPVQQVAVSSSLAILANGNPAISYDYDSFTLNTNLSYAYSSSPVGAIGSWSIVTVDTGDVGGYNSLAILSNGLPSISYYEKNAGNLRFARSSSPFGAAGTWTVTVVDSTTTTGFETSLKVLSNGNPGISYRGSSTGVRFASNNQADGAGVWTLITVDNSAGVNFGEGTSLVVLSNGLPAIAYHDKTANLDLKFASNSQSDGQGIWSNVSVDETGDVGKYMWMTLLRSGEPAIVYYDGTNQVVKFARSALKNSFPGETHSTPYDINWLANL